MPFPDDESVPLTVEAYLDGLWRDMSARLQDQLVTIRRGKADGARQVSAGSCRLVLDDDDGALTPLNPLGIYYPHVRRGVPWRLSYDRTIETFTGRTETDAWGTASDGRHAWTLAGLASAFDVAAGVGTITASLGALRTATTGAYGGTVEVLAKMSVSSLTSDPEFGIVAHHTDSTNMWKFGITTAGTDALKVHKLIGGNGVSWSTPIASIVGGTSYWLRVQAGRRLRMRIWEDGDPEPTTWPLDVFDDNPFNYGLLPLVGAAGVYAQGSGGNTVTFDDIQIDCWLFHGQAGAYRPAYVPTTAGTLRAVQQIEVGGLLRRLGQRSKPLRSALWRENAAGGAVAFWAMGDGADAPYAASALPGGTPMSITAVDWTTGDPEPLDWEPVTYTDWLEPIASPAEGQIIRAAGAIPMDPAVTEWTADFVFVVEPEADAGGNGVQLDWYGNVGAARIDWTVSFIGGDWTLIHADNDPVDITVVSTGPVSYADGRIHHARLITVRDGSDVDWELRLDNVVLDSGTLAGVDWEPLSSCRAQSGSNSGRCAIGFVVAFPTSSPPFNAANAAVVGRAAETAGDREARVCGEANIPFTLVGSAADTPEMGPQPIDTFLNIARECETADQGTLYEPTYEVGLAANTRRSLYNQVASLVVDLATYRTTKGTSRQVLTPVYDDQRIVNEFEVTRTRGSSVNVLNQPSIDADELYDEAFEVNLNSDADLPGYAAWRLAEGGIDEYRNPSLALDLAANPDLIPQWLACDIDSRVQRTSAPYPHPSNTIDQLLDGYAQSIGPKKWDVSANCRPAALYDIGVYNAAGSKYDSAYSTTGAQITTGADTALSVAVEAGRSLWVTGSGSPQFPFDIDLAGARVRVTAISGSSSPQTFTIDATVVNGINKVIPAGTPVRLWAPRRYGL